MKLAIAMLAILFIVMIVKFETSALGLMTSNSTNPTNSSLSPEEAMEKMGFSDILTQSVEAKFGVEANVLYESPHTIILSGKPQEGSDIFWEALDFVKGSGYTIDSVTQVTESDVIGNTRYLSPSYTIFLSK